MAPEFFLQVALLSVLLFTGSIGQDARKPVYRYPHDTVNLHGDDHDRSDGMTSNALPGQDLAFDEGSPIQPIIDGPPYKADNSEKPSPQGSNKNDRPATQPKNAHRFFYRAVPDQNSQSSDRPITFPMNPSQQSQGEDTVSVPQSSPHPYKSKVPQGSSQPPSNAWYSWSPVGSNRVYGIQSDSPQTNGFRQVNNRRPQFYSGNPFGKKLYYSPVNNEQQRSPPGYSTNTQTVNIPAGQRQWFYKYYGPVDYKNQLHVPTGGSELSIQPNPQKESNFQRYVIQARSGYASNRYLASKMSYDPDV